MAKRDAKIGPWIIEALQKNKRLGRNKIYEYVDERYRENRQKKTRLSKDVFSKHLKYLIEKGFVDKNDAGQRGTRIDHFLTQRANQQIQMRTLDLTTPKNKTEKLFEITTQMKFKALYILILMFNHSTSYQFRTNGELQSFLKPFRLGLSILSNEAFLRNKDRIVDEEANLREERHFRTRSVESPDGDVTIFIDEYVNRLHGGCTRIYNCQIRGTTKEVVISNRNNKPFRYLYFSPNQIEEAFDLLCEDGLLHPIPHPYGNYIYTIVDRDLYFLLYSLKDLFTDVWPVLIEIWNYIRNPKREERNWLTLLEGEKEANRIIIEANTHRDEIIGRIQQREKQEDKTIDRDLADKIWLKEKIEMKKQINSRLSDIQEFLQSDLRRYKSIISKHESLQYIVEYVFPDFLQNLVLR